MSVERARDGRRPAGPARVVVLGGGFGGVCAALHLQRLAAKGAAVEVADSLSEFRSEFEEIARARAESDAARPAGGT